MSNGTVTVNDNGYLTATRTNIKDLVINSGKVELHTNGGEGGIDSFGDGNNSYTANGKMAIVTNSVTINGGTLTCGVKNGAYVVKKGNNGYYTTNHATTGFKGSINQTGGTMSVRGDSALSGAFTINQTGGNISTATANAAGRDTYYDNNRPNTFTANKTTYNISQTGNGATLTLKSGATIQANQVDIAGTFVVQGHWLRKN